LAGESDWRKRLPHQGNRSLTVVAVIGVQAKKDQPPMNADKRG